jgi:putative YhdH/YhfP family quinone oxidoreductase
MPSGLSLREAMILGTAGFTAALSLYRMEANGQTPDMGPIVVTGATGGVGMLAIDLLTTAGYEVHAITGKVDQFDALGALGARQCIARQQMDLGSRPLETAIWAGAIDNVGGAMLAGLSRVIHPYGNIASCGLAASADLHTTVMPFIIRGVSILGIASAGTAYNIRRSLWERLATTWKPKHLETILTRTVDLDELDGVFATMLAGGSFGRTLVRF